MADESQSLLLQARVHRQLGAAARLELAFQLSEFARQLALAGLRSRFPTRTDAELRRELLNPNPLSPFPRTGEGGTVR